MANDRFAEVGAALAVLVILLLVEFALFAPTRVMEDAADIVGLCGFGGLATAALRSIRSWTGRGAASVPLGLIGGLSILHGGRPNNGHTYLSGLAAYMWGKRPPWEWQTNDVFLAAAVTAMVLLLVSWVTQVVLDNRRTAQRVGIVMLAILLGVTVLALLVIGGIFVIAQYSRDASTLIAIFVVLATVVRSIRTWWINRSTQAPTQDA